MKATLSRSYLRSEPLEPEVPQEPRLEGAQVHECGQGHVLGVATDPDVAALRYLPLETLAQLDGALLGRGADQQVAEVTLDRQVLLAQLLGEREGLPDVGDVDDDLPRVLAVALGLARSLLLVLAHLLRERGLVLGERLLGELPLLGHRVPARHPDLSDQLVVLHQVPHDALGLPGRLLVPGIDEEEAAVPRHDHAPAQPAARLVVELELVEPVGQRIEVLLLVEGDLDTPLIAAAGRFVPVVHEGDSSVVPLGPRLITRVGPISLSAPQDSWMWPQTASGGRFSSIAARIASLPRWSPALDWSQWPLGGECTTSTAPSGQPARRSRAWSSSRSKLQSQGVIGTPAPSP